MKPPETQPSWARAAVDLSGVVVHVTKLAGVALAVNEALVRTQLRPSVVGLAALMIAGAQGLETFIDRLLGR